MRYGFVFIGLALSVAAQGRTIVVDAAAGAGSDFTALPAAVAAAADGDVVLVRSGGYRGFQTAKALRLLGEAGARVIGGETIEINGLPAGRDFVIVGLTFDLSFSSQVRVVDCLGRVTLDRIDAQVSVQFAQKPSISAVRARQVNVSSSRLVGSPGVLAVDSAVLISDAEVLGNGSVNLHGPSQAFAGVDATRSEVSIGFGAVRGGDGDAFLFSVPAAPAIRANASTVDLRGDGTTVVAAGTSLLGPQYAIASEPNTVLLIDPAVQLLSSGGLPPIVGGPRVSIARRPALAGTGAGPGGAIQLRVVSPQGDNVFLLASLAGDPTRLFGTIWLDLPTAVVIGNGVQGPSELLQFQLQIPGAPGLRGIPLMFQGVSVTATSLALTNPFATAVF